MVVAQATQAHENTTFQWENTVFSNNSRPSINRSLELSTPPHSPSLNNHPGGYPVKTE